jgi:hypothetical protein
MQDYEVQIGARVQVVGNTAGTWDHDQHTNRAPVLQVVRPMPYEPGYFELSSGEIRRASELHYVGPGAANVELYEESEPA